MTRGGGAYRGRKKPCLRDLARIWQALARPYCTCDTTAQVGLAPRVVGPIIVMTLLAPPQRQPRAQSTTYGWRAGFTYTTLQ